MSSTEIAVSIFKKLEPEDLRALQGLEAAMSQRKFATRETTAKYAKLTMRETEFRLDRLNKLGLIIQTGTPYTGYTLNYAGYDTLAINTLIKANKLEAFGKSLGVGKEADVFDALTPDNRRIAIKFHRLGRISFRQTKRKRNYAVEHTSWLYQSRLAAEKEYQALQRLYQAHVAVPEPISQNRHIIAMGMIEGTRLIDQKIIPQPQKILKRILVNVRRAYQKANIIHADLSEYNIILQPNLQILIIDWPQHITKNHPNAQQILNRDLRNILHFFNRKTKLKTKTEDAIVYVTGKTKTMLI
jgi:RIO kinase 2